MLINNTQLISIIIPVYNKALSIKSTIDSVLSQSYNNLEIIVIDDGSTDDSWKVIMEIHDRRLYCYKKLNGGVASARNLGVRKSNGGLIMYLDADDILLPNAVELLVNIREKYNVAIAIGNHLSVLRDGREILFSDYKKEGLISNPFKFLFYRKISFTPGATLVPREIFLDTPQNEALTRYEDAEQANALALHSIAFTPMVTMKYRQQYCQLSMNLDNWDRDYMFHMNVKNCINIWAKLRLARFYGEAICSYPVKKRLIRRKYKYLIFYYFLSRILIKIDKIFR